MDFQNYRSFHLNRRGHIVKDNQIREKFSDLVDKEGGVNLSEKLEKVFKDRNPMRVRYSLSGKDYEALIAPPVRQFKCEARIAVVHELHCTSKTTGVAEDFLSAIAQGVPAIRALKQYLLHDCTFRR